MQEVLHFEDTQTYQPETKRRLFHEAPKEERTPDEKSVNEATERTKDEGIHSSTVNHVFRLPKVEDLKKNFLAAKPPIPTRTNKPVPVRRKEPSKEEEIDYSVTPVSEIITNLSNIGKQSSTESNKQEEIFREVAEVRKEQKVSSHEDLFRAEPLKSRSHKDEESSSGEQDLFRAEPAIFKAKKPVKPVHSLTARSIPKDFREGLKKSSLTHQQIERASEIFSANDNKGLPPLNFDVKNKKKFWENIAKGQN